MTVVPGPTLTQEYLALLLRHCLNTTDDRAGWVSFVTIGLIVERPYARNEPGDFGGETPFNVGLAECWARTDEFQDAPGLLYRVADRERFIEAVSKLHGRERVLEALLALEET